MKAFQSVLSRAFNSSASSSATADVVVCGAGFAGTSTAFHLASNHGASVVLLDELPPLSFTSSASTEAFRAFWPGTPCMQKFVSRSIDLMDQWSLFLFFYECHFYVVAHIMWYIRQSHADDSFHLDRKGYLFLTKEPSKALFDQCAGLYKSSELSTLTSSELCSAYGGLISDEATAAMLVHNAGWMDAHGFGSSLLKGAKDNGAKFIRGKVQRVELSSNDHVQCVVYTDLTTKEEKRIDCRHFVNAAGPFVSHVHNMVCSDVALDVSNCVHAKVVMPDPKKVFPKDSPLIICQDRIRIDWSDDERQALREMGPEYERLTDLLPEGVHIRAFGQSHVLMLWDFMHENQTVAEPPSHFIEYLDEIYPEICLRGLGQYLPALKEAYIECIPRDTYVDGGYYTKSADQFPLIGRVAISGNDDNQSSYSICGAFAGYGLMASMAAGELLAEQISSPHGSLSAELEGFAKEFSPRRFQDHEPHMDRSPSVLQL